VEIEDWSQVNRLKSKASANTRSTQIAVSSSNGGLWLPVGDLVVGAVCGTIGAVDRDSSEGSWGDGDGRESETVVSRTVVSGTVVSGMVASGTSSFATFITSTSGRASVRPDTIVSGFEPSGVWSGRHSRFDFSQRGQTQLLDLGNEREGVG
jgi:hypothetical protein